MNISITGRNTTVTEALREAVEEKVLDALKVVDLKPVAVDVILRYEKNPSNPLPFTCELTTRLKDNVIRVSESDTDMYTAIGLASVRMQRQLRKFKTRIVNKHQQGKVIPQVKFDKSVMDQIINDGYQDDDALVREKVIDFTILTEEEALVQTDLLGHDFFVFTNAQTGLTNVIYHRKNGGYGIIKPKIEEL